MNRPNCQQCGRPLDKWYGGHPRHFWGYGYQGNGKFCTIRCGYHRALGLDSHRSHAVRTKQR